MPDTPELRTHYGIPPGIRKGLGLTIVLTIVTTLLELESYPADELIELRLTRWLTEINFRHLKITLKMDVLKCKTLAGVRKERLVFILVYNLIRVLMLRAVRSRGVNANRISSADSSRGCLNERRSRFRM